MTRGASLILSALIPAALAWLACGPALADEAAIRAAFAQARSAFEHGRADAALDIAEAAWRDAEAEAGETALTAQAAYETARLRILAGTPHAAAEPAARALALAETLAGKGRSVAPPVRLAAELAAFVPEQAELEDIRALARSVVAAESVAGGPDLLTGLGWLAVAQGQLYHGRAADADAAAASASALLRVLPAPDALRLQVLQVETMTAAEAGRYGQAARLSLAAAALTPMWLEDGAGAINPDWAQRVAFAYASAEAYEAFRQRGDAAADLSGAVFPQHVAEPPCRPDWRRQRDARAPREVRGNPAAVLVGFTLGADGAPRDIAVLAAAPDRGWVADLTAEAVEAAGRWRAETGSLAGCAGVTYVAPFAFEADKRP